MPLRPAGSGVWERVPPREGSQDYVAGPGLVDVLLKWYRDSLPWERMERPNVERPDGWSIAKRAQNGGRTVLTLVHGVNEAAVELSFVDTGGEWTDFRAWPLSPEAAHELAMDKDEESRGRGIMIHNARHPA